MGPRSPALSSGSRVDGAVRGVAARPGACARAGAHVASGSIRAPRR